GDSTLSRAAFSERGLTDTTFRSQSLLRDSSIFVATVVAVSEHGVPSASSQARRLVVDDTPPAANIDYPRPGDVLADGASAVLRVRAADWSGAMTLTALLSRDNGRSYSDTVFAGVYADSVVWRTPSAPADSCWIS